MESKNLIFCSLVLLLLVSLSLTISNISSAGTYVGELKWEVKPDGHPSGILTTGITHMGGNYLTVQCYTITSDGDGVIVGDGSAILLNDKILMTLHMSISIPILPILK